MVEQVRAGQANITPPVGGGAVIDPGLAGIIWQIFNHPENRIPPEEKERLREDLINLIFTHGVKQYTQGSEDMLSGELRRSENATLHSTR